MDKTFSDTFYFIVGFMTVIVALTVVTAYFLLKEDPRPVYEKGMQCKEITNYCSQ